jgi:hypothetical protein
VHDKWEDELMFNADGTFSRKTNQSFNSGTYKLSETCMCLLWDNWGKEELYSMDSKLYMNRTFVVNLSEINCCYYKDFCPTSAKLIVERQHENQSVCLVGNASLNIGLCKGKAIDKCDIVVRFNGFTLDESLCTDLGKKTNVVFITTQFIYKMKLFIREVRYLIFNPVNHVVGKEHKQFVITRAFNYYVLNKYYLKEKKKFRPSTGFYAILYYLFYLNYQHIYITNFDFQLCADKPIEYFNNDAKPSQAHDFKYEKEIVLKLISEGYITVI